MTQSDAKQKFDLNKSFCSRISIWQGKEAQKEKQMANQMEVQMKTGATQPVRSFVQVSMYLRLIATISNSYLYYVAKCFEMLGEGGAFGL